MKDRKNNIKILFPLLIDGRFCLVLAALLHFAFISSYLGFDGDIRFQASNIGLFQATGISSNDTNIPKKYFPAHIHIEESSEEDVDSEGKDKTLDNSCTKYAFTLQYSLKHCVDGSMSYKVEAKKLKLFILYHSWKSFLIG